MPGRGAIGGICFPSPRRLRIVIGVGGWGEVCFILEELTTPLQVWGGGGGRNRERPDLSDAPRQPLLRLHYCLMCDESSARKVCQSSLFRVEPPPPQHHHHHHRTFHSPLFVSHRISVFLTAPQIQTRNTRQALRASLQRSAPFPEPRQRQLPSSQPPSKERKTKKKGKRHI